MARLWTDNATSTLAAGIADDATTITLATDEGAKFPSPTGGDYFILTLTQAAAESSWELVKVTARSTDSLTVVRAQEGSSAAVWDAGAKAELRITAQALEDMATSGGGLTWSVVTGATNAAVSNGYACNTTAGAFTVTLPSSPSAGDTIAIKDYAGTFATNALTIGRNSLNIEGLAEDMTVSTNNISFELVYIDATKGWVVA